ncbi:class I SAM-dependent methyltransferase [Comamonas testosteroni]|uniref:class I SAM-dependent methyltransferase n=1 Tax=Comamonas testosteroni TaxID=285 RepID=UPI002DBBC5D4|nr:class I SAM-dependent methyltransferase [Comamonas testosteroni]MEB5967365.1 class I SAM-dependent methyltransferase [Comamonas testosteroni]
MIKVNAWYELVRRTCIVNPLNNDPRETRQNGTRLGKPSHWIFSHAIGGGQANFDEPIEDLSPRDRVMLYALFNQKGHVPELIHAFQKLIDHPQRLNNATVLDIGCGPFTAGLALANVAGNGVAYRYFGADTSQQMCLFGEELANSAFAAGGLNSKTTIEFTDSIDGIDFGQPRLGWTVVVLSYLLASTSLNIDLIVRQIVDACQRIGPGPVAVLYTNSAQPERRAAFPKFQELMVDAGFKCEVVDTELLTDGEKPRTIHYALFTRLPQTIPLNKVTR